MMKITKDDKKDFITKGIVKEYLDNYYGYESPYRLECSTHLIIYFIVYYGSLKKCLENRKKISEKMYRVNSFEDSHDLEIVRKIMVRNKEFEIAMQLKDYIEKVKVLEAMNVGSA